MNDEFPNGMCIRPIEWTKEKLAVVRSHARYHRWKRRIFIRFKRDRQWTKGKGGRLGRVYRKQDYGCMKKRKTY